MQRSGLGYPIERDVDGHWIPDFEEKERRCSQEYGDSHQLSVTEQERRSFWDLFTGEFYCVITSLPLDYVTPLLRRLIDKSWGASSEDIHVDAIHDSIVSLLYYAWDRARETRKLRREVRTLRSELRRIRSGAVLEYAAQERAMGRECGTS
jgi:hypothetical protein